MYIILLRFKLTSDYHNTSLMTMTSTIQSFRILLLNHVLLPSSHVLLPLSHVLPLPGTIFQLLLTISLLRTMTRCLNVSPYRNHGLLPQNYDLLPHNHVILPHNHICLLRNQSTRSNSSAGSHQTLISKLLLRLPYCRRSRRIRIYPCA